MRLRLQRHIVLDPGAAARAGVLVNVGTHNEPSRGVGVGRANQHTDPLAADYLSRAPTRWPKRYQGVGDLLDEPLDATTLSQRKHAERTSARLRPQPVPNRHEPFTLSRLQSLVCEVLVLASSLATRMAFTDPRGRRKAYPSATTACSPRFTTPSPAQSDEGRRRWRSASLEHP